MDERLIIYNCLSNSSVSNSSSPKLRLEHFWPLVQRVGMGQPCTGMLEQKQGHNLHTWLKCGNMSFLH